MNQEYYEFVENNDSEGESWHFFIPTNLSGADKFKAMVQRISAQPEDNGSYEYNGIVDEKIVNMLLKRKSKTGYMNEYNLVKEILNHQKIDNINTFEDFDNYIYKASCFIR